MFTSTTKSYFLSVATAVALILGVIFTLLPLSFSFDFIAPAYAAEPNPHINYQGKLTDTSGVAVPDGTYNMRFWLLQSTAQATTSAVWTESLTGSNKVQVTNGLFSVMLGSTSALTSVDFNQTLYLGVEIGGTSGTPSWDGEMLPRKPLGTVPAAFEAFKLGGVASSSFLRSDEADTLAASAASTLLTINQSGAGDILNLLDGGTEVFTVTDGGLVGIGTSTPTEDLVVSSNNTTIIQIDAAPGWNSELSFSNGDAQDWELINIGNEGRLTFASGVGQQRMSLLANGNIGIATTTPSSLLSVGYTTGSQFLIDTTGVVTEGVWNGTAIADAYLTKTGDWVGTLGGVASSSFLRSDVADTAAGALTFSGGLTMSGAASNIALGSNWLSGDGDDEGIYVASNGRVGIGTSSISSAVLTLGGNIQFANPGIGNDRYFDFDLTSDNAFIRVTETLNDQTRYAFEMSDNPDTSVDRFVWHISDWKGDGADWEPLRFSDLDIEIKGSDINAYGDYNIRGPWYSGGDYPESGRPDTVTESKTGTLSVTPDVSGFTADDRYYVIRIDGTGTPNTFEWDVNCNPGGGSPCDWSEGSGVSITGAAQTLDNGVTITFDGTTGGDIGDTYSFRVYKGGHVLASDGSETAPTFSFSNDSDTGLYLPTTDALALITGASEAMRITAGGNVGIGTTSPNAKLTVVGDVNVSSSTDNLAGYFINQVPVITGSTTLNNYFMAGASSTSFTSGATYNYAIGDKALQNLTTGDKNFAVGRYALSENTSGSNNTAIGDTALGSLETGSNNIAIGNSAMPYPVNAEGNIALGNFALLFGESSQNNIAIGGAAMGNTFDGGGFNVAVGFGALAQNAGTGTIALGLQAADNATAVDRGIFIGYDIDAFSATEDDVLNIGNLIFGTGVDGTGTTLSSGNIGIGTSSPYAKLSVAGTAGQTNPVFQVASSTNESLFSVGPDGQLDMVSGVTLFGNGNLSMNGRSISNVTNLYGSNGSGNDLLVTANNATGDLILGSGVASELVRLTYGGAVGVGTSSPYAKLSVMETTGGTNPLFMIASSTNGAGTSTALLVDAFGNVGIGTANPIARLQVVESGVIPEASTIFTGALTGRMISVQGDGAAYFVGRDVTNDIEFAMGSSNQGAAFAGAMTAHDLQLRTNNTTKLIIKDSSGNVGIGTTSPYATLSVAGDLALTGGLYDNAASLGTAGMVLQSDGSGVNWVATSTLGISGGASAFTSLSDVELGSLTANRLIFASSTGSALTDSANLTFDGSQLYVGGTLLATTSQAGTFLTTGGVTLGAGETREGIWGDSIASLSGLYGFTANSANLRELVSPTVFESGTTNYISATPLQNGNVAVAYQDGSNGNFGTFVIYEPDGTQVVAPTVFESASSREISAVTLQNGNFAILYQDDANLDYGTIVVYDQEGNQVLAPTVFASTDAHYISADVLPNGNIAVAYQDVGNSNYGTYQVIDPEGNEVVAAVVFESGTTQYVSVDVLTNGDVAIVYRDASNLGYGTLVVYDPAGNEVVAPTVFESADTGYSAVTALPNGNFAVAYRDIGNSNHGTVAIYDPAGNEVVAPTVFESATTEYISVATLQNGDFAITYRDVGNSQYVTMAVYDAAGVEVLPPTVVATAGTSYLDVAALQEGELAIAHMGGASFGNLAVWGAAGTTFTDRLAVTSPTTRDFNLFDITGSTTATSAAITQLGTGDILTLDNASSRVLTVTNGGVCGGWNKLTIRHTLSRR